MIALLKQAERPKEADPLGRKVKFVLSRDHNADQNMKLSRTMVTGRISMVHGKKQP